MVGAPTAKEVDQGFAIQSHWELIYEAQLELVDLQEAIFVIVDVFDSTPHLSSLMRLFRHDGRQKTLINLQKALELKVLFRLYFILFERN